MKIFKKFTFDSAHFLPMVPDGHKCKETHGHTYQMTAVFEGKLDEELEWVIDFAEIKGVINPIIDRIDHKLLNDIEGLQNPTCEVIAIWLWNQIKPEIHMLCQIQLNETPTSGVIYEGPIT
ncbi:MAG: 6-carboxytetrahydropterin synthase QueD [Saprospiraceae bacterium]|nr:6-carboxytetrahydropterin synthase QueD [Saprospiraceae bacterium]